MKWEYTSVLFTPETDDSAILNDLGEENWELVAMSPMGKTQGGLPYFLAVFKRPKSESNPSRPRS